MQMHQAEVTPVCVLSQLCKREGWVTVVAVVIVRAGKDLGTGLEPCCVLQAHMPSTDLTSCTPASPAEGVQLTEGDPRAWGS